MPKLSQLREFAGRLARGSGIALMLVLSLCVSTLAHLDSRPVKNTVAHLVNIALRSVFVGELRIQEVESLSMSHLRVARAEVIDPVGNSVLSLTEVNVDWSGFRNMARILRSGSLRLVVDRVRVESARVRLLNDAAGTELTIAQALTVRPLPPGSASASRATVQVLLPAVEIGEISTRFDASELAAYGPRFVGVHGRLQVHKDGVSIDVERFGTTVTGLPEAELHGTGTFWLRSASSLGGTFAGFVGNAEIQASARYEDGLFKAAIDAPRVQPGAARAIWSDWPLRATAELHATAEGKLPNLALNLSAETEHSTLEAAGTLGLAPVRLKVDVDAAGIDLRDWIEGGPESRIDSIASLLVEAGEAGVTAEIEGVTSPTDVLGLRLPKTSYHVHADGSATSLSLEAHEPGAQVSVQAKLTSATQSFESTWKIDSIDLGNQRRIPDGLAGKASLNGQLAYRQGLVQVSANARVSNFSYGDFRAQSGELSVSTTAPWQLLKEAKFRGDVRARGVQYRSLGFANATLKLAGSQREADATLELADPDGRSASLKGRVLPDLSMRDVHAVVTRGALQATLDVAQLNPQLQTIDVSRLDIKGPQINLEGRFRYAPELLDGELHGAGVSLSRLAHLVGLSSLPVTGTLDVDTQIAIGPGLQRASFNAQLHDLAVDHFGRSELELSATLRDDTLTATWNGTDVVAGPFGGDITATLAGPPLHLESYRNAIGVGNVEVRDLPLETLGLLPLDGAVSDLDGRIGLRLQFQRSAPDALPIGYFQLSLSGASGVIPKISKERLPVLGALATGNYDPQTSDLRLSLALNDSSGMLATASGQLTLLASDLFAHPELAAQTLKQAPLNLTLDVPPRKLASYPFEATRELKGTLGAHITVSGNLNSPNANAIVNVSDLTSLGFSERSPVSFTANGQYAAQSGDTQLFITGISQGRPIINGELKANLPWQATELPTFQGSGKLVLDALPLDQLAALQEIETTGSVSGTINWDSRAEVPFDTRLSFDKLYIRRAPLGTGVLRLSGRSDGLAGRFDLKHNQSSLAIDLVTHGAFRQLEAWNDLESVDCSVVASQLNAAILSPFLDTILARLGGKLDAQFRVGVVRVDPAKHEDRVWQTRVDGTASLTDGTGYIDGLGLELQDVSVAARTARVGALTQLRLSDFRAKARSEAVNLRAVSNLNFDGIKLVSGDLNASLNEVPLTLQGINLGRATGQAKTHLVRKTGWQGPEPFNGSDYLDATITLDNWRLHTTASASRSLIGVEPNADIVVAQRPSQASVANDVFPYRFHIHLGDDVRVMLTSQEVPLGGIIGIDLTDTAQFSGEVTLKPGGRLLVLGRVFEVVTGIVRFNPRDASNPDLNLALSGRALDGSTVYVSVVGTWNEPITDPPQAKLQELLGGGTASALSGGIQALGLGSIFGSSFQLRVSDSDPGESVPSYSAAVKIDEDLWFEANYQREGDSLSQKDSAVLSGTLDYRFQDNWSLRTKVGTTSGSLDLAWEYRY